MDRDKDPLMISYRKPHKPVSSASISRWMKELLTDASVDTEAFKAHSVRAASVSTAKLQGVSMADILKMVGWARQSTFEKFYYKPVEETKYGTAASVYLPRKGKSLNNTLSYMQPCHDMELMKIL